MKKLASPMLLTAIGVMVGRKECGPKTEVCCEIPPIDDFGSVRSLYIQVVWVDNDVAR